MASTIYDRTLANSTLSGDIDYSDTSTVCTRSANSDLQVCRPDFYGVLKRIDARFVTVRLGQSADASSSRWSGLVGLKLR
jgi:hypothetical protein